MYPLCEASRRFARRVLWSRVIRRLTRDTYIISNARHWVGRCTLLGDPGSNRIQRVRRCRSISCEDPLELCASFISSSSERPTRFSVTVYEVKLTVWQALLSPLAFINSFLHPFNLPHPSNHTRPSRLHSLSLFSPRTRPHLRSSYRVSQRHMPLPSASSPTPLSFPFHPPPNMRRCPVPHRMLRRPCFVSFQLPRPSCVQHARTHVPYPASYFRRLHPRPSTSDKVRIRKAGC
ncbi:hypothetical protein FB451DRAFT_396079 [Mycena latifolia]|nr:hypothetical protein FB451DRAFT_396079 [Mycena latifolia]